MIAKAESDKKDECKALWLEAKELTLIFSSILLSKKQARATGSKFVI